MGSNMSMLARQGGMNYSELKKAVADCEAPTPGYLFQELARWTFLDFSTQQQLLHALMEKLQKKNSSSPFVLYKTLHLIQVLCETGHTAFQKELQLHKYTSVLKDLTTYNRSFDAAYGHHWNAKVRRAAEEALEAVFHTRAASTLTESFGVVRVADSRQGDWSGMGNTNASAASTSKPANEGVQSSSGSGGTLAYPYHRGGAYVHGGAPAPSISDDPFDTLSAHVGELPRENKWAQHQREMAHARTAEGVDGALGGGEALLRQITSTAKEGMRLMAQFEMLHTTQERLYGNEFRTAAARASAGYAQAGMRNSTKPGVDAEGGSYQPIGVPPTSSPEPEDRDASGLGSVGPRNAPGLVRADSESIPTPPATAESRFRFLRPSRTDSSALVHPAAEGASVNPSALAHLVEVYTKSTQAPSRVALSQFVQAAEATLAKGQDGNDGDPDETAASRSELGEALSTHLCLERPWQERLNALACLEAALRSTSPILCSSLVRFFTGHPHYVQCNFNVVQASLREKAGKVAQLLHISPVPVTARATCSVSAVPTQLGTKDTLVDDSGSKEAGSSEVGRDVSSSAAAASSVPPHDCSFENMLLHTAGGGHTRAPGSTAASSTPLLRSQAAEDGTGRPLRRRNPPVAASTTPGSPFHNEVGEVKAMAGAIHVLRTSAAAEGVPGSSAAQRVARGRVSDNDALDSLFERTTVSGAAPPTSIASQKAAAPVSTEDLFATPWDPAAPPTVASSSSSSAAAAVPAPPKPTRMGSLSTHHDPVAAVGLERLVMQQPRHDPPTEATAHEDAHAVALGHHPLQLGGGTTAQATVRQHVNQVFAAMQAEMEQQMKSVAK